MANCEPPVVKSKQSPATCSVDPRHQEEPSQQAAQEPETAGTPEQPTYAWMVVQKTLGVYIAKPYSLAGCSRSVGRLRIVALFVLVAVGIAGTAFFRQPEPFHLARIWATGGFLGSIALLLWGVGLFLFGFVRSLMVWPAGILLVALWTGGRFALEWAWARSPLLFAALALFLFAVLIGALRYLIKILLVSFSATFWQYERDGILRAADLPLGELPTVKGYTTFLSSEMQIPFAVQEEEPASEIGGLLRDCICFCARRRLIFCGYVLDTRGKRLTLFFYADDAERARRAVMRFVSKQGLTAEVTLHKDPDWQRFRADVYPNEMEYQQIHNRYLYDNMEAGGFDFSQTVPQIFTFYFSESKDARAFAKQSVSLGYDDARYFDREQQMHELGDDPAFSHAVCAQLTGRVGLARMNCNTDRAMELAQQFHGQFYEWEIGRLSPEA
ncbi:MAG: ribonuclease E inhibitor RraB [Ethanoligenens sp.]